MTAIHFWSETLHNIVLYFYQAGLGGKQRPSGVTYSTHIDYQRSTSLPLCAVILWYIHKHCQTISCPCHGRWMFKLDPARWGINSYVELIPKKNILKLSPSSATRRLSAVSEDHPCILHWSDSVSAWQAFIVDWQTTSKTENWAWCVIILCFNSRSRGTFPSSF